MYDKHKVHNTYYRIKRGSYMRSGITYLDVVKAADGLLAENRNPTIDNVREALGHRGSKSTLSPLLKRWRDEHRQPERAELGIPEDLFLAAKNIYETVKQQFETQLRMVQTEHTEHLQQLQAELTTLKEEHSKICAQTTTLVENLETTKREYDDLKNREAEAINKITLLHLENSGLSLQINALSNQLSNVNRQFDHFQTTSAEQRTQERQAYEQKLVGLEQLQAQLQDQRLQQQLELGQKNTLVALREEENRKLYERLQQLEIDHNDLQRQHAMRDQQLRELEQMRNKHSEQHLETEKIIAQMQTELAVKQMESKWIKKRHVQLKKKYRILQHAQADKPEAQHNDSVPSP